MKIEKSALGVFLVKVNSHETADGIVAGLAAWVAGEFALVNVFAVVTVRGKDVADLARTFFLPGGRGDAKLLAPRVSRAGMHCRTVILVFALQTVLVTVANVLLTDAIVLPTLPRRYDLRWT